MDKLKEEKETDPVLKAVSKIFDVMVWNRNIPPCYFEWIRRNLQKKIWQLSVVPFAPITCKSRIENNGVVDVEYYECGFFTTVKGESMGGFNHRHISKGDHENLHQVIHCLNQSGIPFGKIQIEQWFGGCKPDILGETTKGEKCIIVELGKISKIEKLLLVDKESVKELWFGDNDRFIYTLSRRALNSQKSLREEADNYFRHIQKYYENHCKGNGQLYSCISSYSAYNCIEDRTFWEKRNLTNI
jgi:hypothetical protein